MSSERSSSAVRSLRSIFENKASESSSDLRGRSPGALSDFDNQRPRSKVRSNFIAVDLSKAAAARVEMETTEGSTEVRRGSFSGGTSGKALEGVDAGAGQGSAVSSTVATPLVEINKQLGPKNGTQKQDKPAANPDKPTTGAEEEPASMKPADPASEAAVSGGKSLPSAAEDLRKAGASKKPAAKSTVNGRPSVLPKDLSKPSSSAKPSPSQPKSPLSPLKAPLKKPSRSSLTAPTAASAARASAAEKGASAAGGRVSSPPSKARPRDVTKPIEVSSHLMAPTAASRARQDPAPTASKPALAARPKPTATSRPAPRASLAGRPDSGASQGSKTKPAGPPDGSFLERMTRPTAASTNKSHQEKPEVKSPPRKQASALPKPASQTKPSQAKSVPAVSKSTKPGLEETPTVEKEAAAQATEEKPQVEAKEAAPEEESKVDATPAPAPTPAAVPEPTPEPAPTAKADPEPIAEPAAEPVVPETEPEITPVPLTEPAPEASAASKSEATPEPAAKEENPAAVEESAPAAEVDTPKPDSTPAESQDTALEATPVALTEEDSIR